MHIFGGGGGAGERGGKPGPKAAASSVPSIGERDFEQAVLLAETPMLAMFMSARSQASAAVLPELEAFVDEMAGKIGAVMVDIDQNRALAQQLRIQQIPTFMLFAEQRLADVQVGPLSRKALRAMVEPHMPRSAGLLKARELAELIKQGVVTPVDVRDAAAYGRAHLPGASSLPAEELEGRLAELYMLPGQPALYDRSGDKAKELAEKLEAQGTPVAFLEGGILAWEAEGLPIERP